MGYGESAAQILGTGTGGWNLERLQLKGAGRGNKKIQDMKLFFCRLCPSHSDTSKGWEGTSP